MLTGLQERVARIVAALEEADGFALAGGAAVIIHGVVDRDTDDLDYFGATVEDVGRLARALRAALLADELEVETVAENRGFVRLHVRSTAEETTIDLGTDARLLPTHSGGLDGPRVSVPSVVRCGGRTPSGAGPRAGNQPFDTLEHGVVGDQLDAEVQGCGG
ncbi:MAG: hypothetical protein WEB06_15195, partial [Actinomycetota bacterium]